MGKLILISKNTGDQDFCKRVGANTGVDVITFSDTGKAIEGFANEKEVCSLFIEINEEKDFRDFENHLEEKIGLYSEKVNSNHFHFISSLPLESLPFLSKSNLFGSLVTRNFESDIELSSETYSYTLKNTLRSRAFGIEHLLSPNTKIQTVKLNRSNQKNDAVEAINAYLLSAKFQARVSTLISNAVDELILNAVFDAPVDALGKSIYAQTPRSEVITLADQSAVELKVGFDGKRVAISVVDNFGSLNKQRLLEHVSKAYKEEEYQLRLVVANAGIGLASIFRMGASLFFVSESQNKTEVTVLFHKTTNYKSFRTQFRFLSTQFYF